MTDTYPILVERFSGKQSMTIVCERCHTEQVITPDHLLNEGIYLCPRDAYAKPVVCGGTAVMKYDEGEKCKGCGQLGYHEATLDYCCSRKCQLQAEYAAALREKAA